ncbi:TonB-dependent Receptor Plug Domain [Stigmatella aurantiaca]|uniref:TonB-dependent Receptor Plug Domain n=1 Tax=Stigmatella aurantiaca TaxID=41 RepID=A0A1H7UXG6_STIAU|nr:TonB-dependent receptor [Stigmatella aurantiaca]SEM01207.1 TonB-dependent Receptor Plug Domain [Stigmatella aurantiaca]
MNLLPRVPARALGATLALAFVLWALPTWAQQGASVLTGTVLDASSQQPVADVVVTATAATLQGEEVAVTDSTGLYRLPQLPPGVYTLRFEREGYQPYSRAEVTLRLNRTIRLNVQILPDEFQTSIEVSGTPPAIDVGSTRTGVSVGAETVQNLALIRPGSKGSAARSFEGLAELAPGATSDAYGISLNGTSSPENGFLVDGLATGNPAIGVLGSPVSVEFIEEVNVITGGFMPEFGRATGGVVTAVTKSGSNEFHGSLFTNLTPGFLEGEATRVAREGSVITTDQKLWNLGDFGATLGGPLLKDKLWFFAGVAPSFTRRRLERNLNTFVLDEQGQRVRDAEGFSRTERIPDTTTTYFADQRAVQYLGKLTWQAATDHTLTLSAYGSPTRSGGEGRFAYRPEDQAVEVENIAGAYSALAHRNTQDSRDLSLKLASSFLDKKVLLDANIGWHHQNDTSLPVDGSGIGNATGFSGVPQFEMRRNTPFYAITDLETLPDPSVCNPVNGVSPCTVTNYLLGGPGLLLDRTVERYQGNVVGTLLLSGLGHHVIKAGLDVEVMQNKDTRAYSGRVLYREAVNGSTFQDFRAFGYLTGPDEAVVQPSVPTSTRATAVGGFLQDSWSVMDTVTLNVGLRYDAQTIEGNNGAEAFDLSNQFSPRVGVIYDFTQQGRSKLFASYARYYQNAVLAMVNSQFSNITRLQANRNRAAQNGAPGCDPLRQEAPYTECRDERNIVRSGPESVSRLYSQTFAINSPVDPDLKPQSSDEFVLGGEYELLPGASVGITYTHRNMNDVIEDMSRNEATNYFIGNPGRGIASDFPKAVRDYDAVSLLFNKTFSDLWLIQANYTWSRLHGNYSGLFRPENLQLAPNVTSDFDLVSLTENHTGLLPIDRTHSLKFYGAKELMLSGSASLNLGLSYRGASGAPLNVLGTHYIYGPDFTFILPRGSGGRLPWVHAFDTRLAFNYRLTRDTVATVSLDLFNLFNFQAVTSMDQRYTEDTVDALVGGTPEQLAGLTPRGDTSRTVVVNPNYGKPLSYQPPRSVRLGARLSF